MNDKKKELGNRIKNFENRLNNSKSSNLPNGVYAFVSFDLVNSTKFKYRNPNWIVMIKELIKMAKSTWFGLDFWKFNGDEILFCTELTSFSQLVTIIRKLYPISIELQNDLVQKIRDGKSEVRFESDLVGITTSIWLAVVSENDKSLNSRLFDFDLIDFAGMHMDEGFRMSKHATQNKLVVDPKIALLITSIAYAFQNKTDFEKDVKNKNFDQASTMFDDVFLTFWSKANHGDCGENIEDSFKIVADNFRIVSFESCKGVWDERPYPIIWYSDNWIKIEEQIKYDEHYKQELVTSSFVNKYYFDKAPLHEKTLSILKNIYKDVSAYGLAIRQIFLNTSLKLVINKPLGKQMVPKTFLYHSIACLNPKEDAVLIFLRSKERGHLPNVWDFDHQKNAHEAFGKDMISQIEFRFKNNFDLNVEVLTDKKHHTLLPLALQPVYRKGKVHHGILCLVKIKDNFEDETILKMIRDNLSEIQSIYGYPLYDNAMFVKLKTSDTDNPDTYFSLEKTVFNELSLDTISSDSNTWQDHNKPFTELNSCVINMRETINDILNKEYRTSSFFSSLT